MATNVATQPSPASEASSARQGQEGEELFNRGEIEMQLRAGTRDFAERLGRHKIHDYIAPELKDFVELRHAIYLSSEDPDNGAVWASVVFADPSDSQIPYERRSTDGEQCREEEEGQPPQRHSKYDVASSERVKQSWTPPGAPFCKPLDTCSVAVATSTMTSAFQSSAYTPLVSLASPKLLVVCKPPVEGDPFWKNASFPGAQVGIGFVEFETRRRFRVSGVIKDPVTTAGFSVEVRESFSVCPKYIQRRTIDSLHRFPPRGPRVILSDPHDPSLPPELVDFIVHSDTFMIATMADGKLGDASHRGGRPGFVRVADRRTLLWGDYVGKGLFQTLGNTLLHAETGLLFIDFEKGPTLQLSGTLKVEWTEPGASLDDSDRLVIFTVNAWRYHDSASPFHWKFIDMSSHHPILEDRAALLRKYTREVLVSDIKKAKEDILIATIDSINRESFNVKTIRFTLPVRLAYQPGQYATFTFDIRGKRYMRSFTIASANLMQLEAESAIRPVNLEENSSKYFEISVRLNPGGTCSKWLHEEAHDGDIVYLMGVEGSFTLDSALRIATRHFESRDSLERPFNSWWKVLFLTGGIGLTPMMSMMRGLKHTIEEGHLDKDQVPAVSWLHSERTARALPFGQEIAQWAETGMLDFTLAITDEKPVPDDRGQQECSRNTLRNAGEILFGHVDHNTLQTRVPFLADRIVYLCGPNTFMGAMVEYLTQLGVPPAHILVESFDY